MAIDPRQFFLSLVNFFLFALLFSLRHDELVGADALMEEIDVQQDQIDQQYRSRLLKAAKIMTKNAR